MPIDALHVLDLWRSLVEEHLSTASSPTPGSAGDASRSSPTDGSTLFRIPESMTPTTCTPMAAVYPPGGHLLDGSASAVGATVVDRLQMFLHEHRASLARPDEVRRAAEFVYPVV